MDYDACTEREGGSTYKSMLAYSEGGRVKNFHVFCVRNKWMTPMRLFSTFSVDGSKMKRMNAWSQFPDLTPPTPDALLEIIWCNCATDTSCSWRSCSCTNAQLSCTKFCKCYGRTCFNSWTVQENSDNESKDELEREDRECLKVNL